MPKESENCRTAWIKLSDMWVVPLGEHLNIRLGLWLYAPSGPHELFWASVTKNRTPQRRSGGPLSTKTGRQIQDSSNGKTGNQSDLWNSKPEQATFISKLWFDINWFKWWSPWVLLVLDLYICALTTVHPIRWLALELMHQPNTKSCLTLNL